MNIMNPILNKISRAVCFVVDKRYQNWANIQDQLTIVGFEPELFLSGGENLDLPYNRKNTDDKPPKHHSSTYYQTWWNRNNAYNAWLSRRQVLEECVSQGHKWLALFEDDIKVEDDFLAILETATPFLETLKFDALYFGGYHNNGSYEKTKHQNVIRVRGSGGWHAIMFNRQILMDLLVFEARGPYDWLMGNYLHDLYNCYAITPCIITQTDGISEVEGHHLSKPSRFLKV